MWICRILAALIMLQTLYYKFTGAPESVYIFTALDMEPYGRYSIGIAELVASILILFPRTSLYGAFLALVIMLGAIGSHLFILGIEILNDGGHLFIYSLIVTLSCLVLIYGYTKRIKPEP